MGKNLNFGNPMNVGEHDISSSNALQYIYLETLKNRKTKPPLSKDVKARQPTQHLHQSDFNCSKNFYSDATSFTPALSTSINGAES
jgi:hypothetical protein